MSKFRIAVLPGDGIGPEVMEPSLRVLQSACQVVGDLTLEFTEHQAGAEHYRRTGEVLPQAVLDDCLAADAVFLAAIGLPDVRLPDGTEVQPIMMVGLRRALDLYAAVRPIKLYPGVPSTLKDTDRGIDFVILRENLEGLFSSFGGGYQIHDEVAGDNLVITRAGTERVAEFGFQLARKRAQRRQDPAPTVTCVDKANVFRSFAFFRKVFFDVAARHQDVEARAEYVDAASMYMVQHPHVFDVMLTENQFGDILSDLGAGLVGGLGLAPSAEIGDRHGLFQPSHGTAPTIVGQDIANPLATILSAAMMLDWLADRHNNEQARAAGALIEQAVARLLADGTSLPRDLGGSSGTQAIGSAVVAQLERTTSSSPS